MLTALDASLCQRVDALVAARCRAVRCMRPRNGTEMEDGDRLYLAEITCFRHMC